MKKRIVLTGLLLVLFLFNCVEQGDDSIEQILKDFSSATEVVTTKISEAEENANKDEAIAAFKEYSDKVRKIVKRLKTLKKRSGDADATSKEISAVKDELRQIAGDFGNLIKKMAIFLNDTKVMNEFRKASADISELFKQ